MAHQSKLPNASTAQFDIKFMYTVCTLLSVGSLTYFKNYNFQMRKMTECVVNRKLLKRILFKKNTHTHEKIDVHRKFILDFTASPGPAKKVMEAALNARHKGGLALQDWQYLSPITPVQFTSLTVLNFKMKSQKCRCAWFSHISSQFAMVKQVTPSLCTKIFHMQLLQVHHYMMLAHAHNEHLWEHHRGSDLYSLPMR